jgi:hypothetical protein
MDVPPSRYKVVEQGRRLVVLDRWNGDAPVVGHVPQPKLPSDSARPASVEQARDAMRRPGPAGFTLKTERWFDDQAPRVIRVGEQGRGRLLMLAAALLIVAVVLYFIGWMALLVAGFLLLQPRARSGLRVVVTELLTGLGERIG